ncbi:MAG TPA: zincin-like metallopeptidase domain-containing protein [Azospirillaceae bacterium]|nr:zincin-like metallopeptidase domain-containing protein [Azospirillaceae bacterium]
MIPLSASCQRVLATVLDQLARGVRPWHQPWSPGTLAARAGLPLRACGRPYQGLNIVLLWMAQATLGVSGRTWMTRHRAGLLGASVRPGERSATVIYAAPRPARPGDPGAARWMIRLYDVFNTDSIDGLPARFHQPAPAVTPGPARIAAAEAFVRATGATIRLGGTRAYYALGPDHIAVPELACFRSAGSYYATLAHELVHWTRHPSRLDRDLGRRRFGDAGYAREELVAELGAAFLCAELGLEPEVRQDHAAYLATWLALLRHDPRELLGAAGHAQRAVDHLTGLAAARPLDPAA